MRTQTLYIGALVDDYLEDDKVALTILVTGFSK